QREIDRQHIARAVSDYCVQTGIELPIPAAHFAAIMLAIGDGLSAQRHLDPDAVPSDLFGAATIWLWNGVWDGTPPVA
ncbi:MAG TPA: hypothetical protein VMY34_05510, partial [Acidimicrobiales bacterium]|nr:hypothetical protein [Acidimicrobiales bacterium]